MSTDGARVPFVFVVSDNQSPMAILSDIRAAQAACAASLPAPADRVPSSESDTRRLFLKPENQRPLALSNFASLQQDRSLSPKTASAE